LEMHTRVAIHTGQHRRALHAATSAETALGGPSVEACRRAACIVMLCALATDEVTRTNSRLATTPVDHMVPRLGVDVAVLPQIVRFARAAGNEALAMHAVAIADERVRLNPGAPSIEAAAFHARGLADDDVALLERAVERFATTPRRLAHASALEDWGVALVENDDGAGIDALSDALRVYTATGAAWDASRVRRRLRRRGVRRRIVTTPRPATGWDGLTDAERSVVHLVAEGLTNRQVAERLYISPHTASMHLRHVFTKLGINSRVELTRLVLERATAA